MRVKYKNSPLLEDWCVSKLSDVNGNEKCGFGGIKRSDAMVT